MSKLQSSVQYLQKANDNNITVEGHLSPQAQMITRKSLRERTGNLMLQGVAN